MLDPAVIEVVTRSLMLGTARQPILVARAFGGAIAADDPKAALKALALLAQFQRFHRPPAGDPITIPTLVPDGRRSISEDLRPLFCSLLAGKGGGDVVALAVADVMAQRQLQVHPFDLPRLDAFVKAHCEQLGPGAAAWVDRHADASGNDLHAHSFSATLDETNWTQGRPAQKAQFIAELRATDAARARQLVEAALPGEQAPARLRLVSAIAKNLSAEDIPFLESLATDRAPSVRDEVERLLASLPGTPQASKQLQECTARIKLGKAGLLRRRTTLQADYPVTANDDEQRWQWAMQMFDAIPLDAFARALGLSADEAMTAAADDPALTKVMAAKAVRARRYDLLASALQRDPALAEWAFAWIEGPDVADPASVEAWSATVVQPELWSQMPNAHALGLIYQKTRIQLPEAMARRVLDCKMWRNFIEQARAEPPPWAIDTIAAIVVLMPATSRAALRADLALLAPHLVARGFAALSLLDHLEAA